MKHKSIFIVTLLVAVVSFGIFMLAVVNGWMGEAANVGGAFCEEARAGLIKQPANTWSNAGFIIAGLLMAWQLSHGRFAQNKNRLTQSIFTATFFSCLVVLLGPGSMAMHATETSIGGMLDILSMYLVVAFAASYAMQRFFGWSNGMFVVSFAAIILICEYADTFRQPVPVVHYWGNAAFGFFILLSTAFELLNGYVKKITLDKKYGYYCLAFLILAFFIWSIWQDGSPLCNPGSLIQGHAMWHLLCAVAVYFLFRFYMSEHAVREV